jgi:predicted ArsR family transcriptional regulator
MSRAFTGTVMSTVQEHSPAEHIRPIDQAVLDLLRQQQGLTVHELIAQLEVTATAVRQRLDRLEHVGLVERRKEGVGRGRPQFRYFLTPLGTRYASASYADLAMALWQEVMELPNPQLRGRIIRRVARRMGEQLKQSIPLDATLTQRMEAMAMALGQRKVPAMVNDQGILPVLQVHACPYPELSQQEGSRQMCEMEQEMLSEAIGQPVQLDCCRLDGHNLCQFRPVPLPDPTMTSFEILPAVD